MGFRTISRLSALCMTLVFSQVSFAQEGCCAVAGTVRVKVWDKQSKSLAEVSPVGVKVRVDEDPNIQYTISDSDGVYVLFIPKAKIKTFHLTFIREGCPKEHDRDKNEQTHNKRPGRTLTSLEGVKAEGKTQLRERAARYKEDLKTGEMDGNKALTDSAKANLSALKGVAQELSFTARTQGALGHTDDAMASYEKAVALQEELEPASLSLAELYEDYAGLRIKRNDVVSQLEAKTMSQRATIIRKNYEPDFSEFATQFKYMDSYVPAYWKEPLVWKADLVPGQFVDWKLDVKPNQSASIAVVGVEPGACELKMPENPNTALRPQTEWSLYGGKGKMQVVEQPGVHSFRVTNRLSTRTVCIIRIQ